MCTTGLGHGYVHMFKIPHADVALSLHDPGAKKASGAAVLRITMFYGTKAEFKDFAAVGDLQSALALIEHLVESCKNL